MPHHLQNPKWPPRTPKWPMGSGKGSTKGYWAVVTTFAEYIFDSSFPSMRNIEPPAKSKMVDMGPQNVQWGIKEWNRRLLAALINFCFK